MTDRFDHHVLGIGNAIVDVLSLTDDAFLVSEGLAKGSMNTSTPSVRKRSTLQWEPQPRHLADLPEIL